MLPPLPGFHLTLRRKLVSIPEHPLQTCFRVNQVLLLRLSLSCNDMNNVLDGR